MGKHVVVRADQVLGILDRLAEAHVTAWVDGGWGVDALLGEQTREHQDLDLVVDTAAVGRLQEILAVEGFEIVRDWLPTAIAFRHPDGREIDLHPVELTPDGGGDQIQLDGVKRFHYDPPTTGRIGERTVRRCALATQIRSHLGYEPDGADIADMQALANNFGHEKTPPYVKPGEEP